MNRAEKIKNLKIPLLGRRAVNHFKNVVDGKNVVVVGAAGYLQGRGQGELIDKHDIVVRINHALPITNSQDYGTKTNILYHIMSRRNIASVGKRLITEDEIKQWDIDMLVIASRNGVKRVMQVRHILQSVEFPYISMDRNFFIKYKNHNKKYPNTGIYAILHLLENGVKSLRILGFDFYQSGVYEGYGDFKEGETAIEVNKRYHDIDSQIEMMKNLYKNDNRLIIDNVLEDILCK